MANLVESVSDTIFNSSCCTEKNYLCKILDTSSVNENKPVFINPSFYHDDQMLLDQLSKHKSKFSLLSLNIHSINAKIDELRILIENLRLKNCHFSACNNLGCRSIPIFLKLTLMTMR